MKLSYSNKVNFTSKIICISPQEFNDVVNKFPVNSENITNWDIEPPALITGEKRNYEYDKKAFGHRHDIENAYTYHIKSCTGGLIADKNKKQASLFSHLKNSVQNINNIQNLNAHIHGTNAIFVGGKSRFYNSMELISSLINLTKKNDIPTTYMRDLNFYHEINMAYSGKKDALYICIKKIHSKDYVKSMGDLKKAFKKVFISSADTIEFGKQKSLISKISKNISTFK